MLKAQIMEVIEATNQLRESPDYELHQLSQRDPDILDRVCAKQKEQIDVECATLSEEARALAGQIPIRELHARTGHFVRKAAGNVRVIITDHGKPVAQLQALGETAEGENQARPKWKDRVLVPEYEAIMNIPVGGTDSTQIII